MAYDANEHEGLEPSEVPSPADLEEARRDRRDVTIVIAVIVGGFVLGIFALLASLIFF